MGKISVGGKVELKSQERVVQPYFILVSQVEAQEVQSFLGSPLKEKK